MIREGAKVAYTGPETDGLIVGDKGRVVLADGNVFHVLWSTGAMQHQSTPHYEGSLVTYSAISNDMLDDSLDLGGLSTFSARKSFDAGGEAQVVAEMNEEGHLASFADIAEEALVMVAARVRQDPSFRVVASELDEEEADGVVRYASACLIRDAFGSERDD